MMTHKGLLTLPGACLMVLFPGAGALCALALGQHIQDTQAALLGSRWPTAKAGLTYIALLAACVLGPGLITLWATLLLLKLSRPAKRSLGNSCGASHTEGGEGKPAVPVEAANAYSGAQTAVRAVSAAAVAALSCSSSGRLLAAADGSLQLQLPAPPKQQALHASAGASSAASAAQPVPHAAAASVCLPVARGRPPLQQLVKGWVATQQQLVMHAHHSGERCYTVYAMGPEKLVVQVQELCDDVAGLSFVRRTHQL